METNKSVAFSQIIQSAVAVLRNGGVIAYPTEYCFGLGCDPRNESAVLRLLEIKRRKAEQGVILIAADLNQINCYANFDDVSDQDLITATWPGPNTWLLPTREGVPEFIRGRHATIAMRIPQHDFCLALLAEFGHPIVSTSANRSGEPEHLVAETVEQDLGDECDLVVNFPVGGAKQASTIRDAMTGAVLR